MLTIKLLGSPLFYTEDRALSALITGRVAALFIYLIVTQQPQPRTTLANLLWNNGSEQDARKNLRYLLRDLRKIVGEYVVVNGESISFAQELPHWVDVTTFATHLNTSSIAGEDTAYATILQELLNLYTGEFLAGFQIDDAPIFEDWMLGQRRYLHDLAIKGFQLRTQQHLAEGEYEQGLTLNRYLLTLEPWREEAHRQRMLLLACLGQRTAALKQYEICCQTLAEELDAPPMEQTTTLYEQIKSGQWFMDQKAVNQRPKLSIAVPSFPQEVLPSIAVISKGEMVDAPDVSRHLDLGAMPHPTCFFGRQAELATLDRWIDQEGCRLVAILGVSGQGKTALAATFVQQVIADEESTTRGFTHIIWRSLQETTSCIEILCDWLQQLDSGPIDKVNLNFDHLVAKLFMLLQERRCLLVLDNLDAILEGHNLESHNLESHNLESQGRADRRHGKAHRANSTDYDRLFRLFFQRRHQSCLLLTGRKRPPLFTYLDERNGVFRSMELEGLNVMDCASLCVAYGIEGDQALFRQLHQRYAGNPLLLSQSAELIYTLFDCDGAKFLQEEFFFVGDIGLSLATQLAQLSSLELEVVHTIVQAGHSLFPEQLWQQLPSLPTKQAYYRALQTLQRSFLIYQEDSLINLSDLLLAYFSDQAPGDVEGIHFPFSHVESPLAMETVVMLS